MPVLTTATAGARRSALVGAEAMLVAAIIAVLVLALSPVSGAAALLSGAGTASARGNAAITVPDGVFAGTTTATVNPGGDAWVRGRCDQDGVHVYEQYVRVDSNNQAVLTLGPTPIWSSGPASCTAEELILGQNARWKVLAKVTFSVSG